jgi:hypothetical protein
VGAGSSAEDQIPRQPGSIPLARFDPLPNLSKENSHGGTCYPSSRRARGEYGALRIESIIVPGENVTALDIDYGCAIQSH